MSVNLLVPLRGKTFFEHPQKTEFSYLLGFPFKISVDHPVTFKSISYPESSGFLVSGWSPVETLRYWNFITAGFLRQNNGSRYGTANRKI